MNIVFFKAKKIIQSYIEKNRFRCNILGFVDDEYGKECFCGYPVCKFREAASIISRMDYIVIFSENFLKAYRDCVSLGIDDKQMIFTANYNLIDGFDLNIVQCISPYLFNKMTMEIKQIVNINERDYVEHKKLIGTEKFSSNEYMTDYFRYRTFEFAADEILENQIDGDIAELGVFRGLFSALISAKFPDRKIHLFDTFSGFCPSEAKVEKELGRIDDSFIEFHKQSSVDIAVSGILNPERVFIYKGIFPSTITEQAKELSFSFVSIDVDLEESTFEGIKFFYPRLTEGGYIFLHDYNSRNLFGVRNSMKRYIKELGIDIPRVPLADQAGTLVLTK